MKSSFATIATALFVLIGLGIAMFAGITHSKMALLVLIAFLPLAWLFVLLFALLNPGKRTSVLSLLRKFRRQVDSAKQQFRDDAKSIDRSVLSEFDTLQAELKALLARKKVRLKHLRQEILQYLYPADQQQGPRWRPPTLSELGYVIGVVAKFSPDTPLLALYKFSGEGRNTDGTMANTFTIMAASVPPAHAALFAAKVYSPIVNSAAVNSQPVILLGPPTLPPRPATKESVALDEDNGMGYALSLLGPISLSSTRELARNLQAIVRLPADTATPALIPAATLRRILRDLLTEKLEHAQAPLHRVRRALLQAPQLLIVALADASRDLKDSAAELLPALTTLAEILAPAPASHPTLVSLMSELVASIQSLRIISPEQAIVNPGIALIDGRGAETDAGFLKRIVQCEEGLPNATTATVIVATNLTEAAFRAQLQVYADMKPGKDDQAVIDALLIGLNLKKITLNTVRGNHALKVQSLLQPRVKKPTQRMRWLLISANPALVDLTGSVPPAQQIIWTMSGRGLDAGRLDFKTLYADRWRVLTAPSQSVGTTARATAGTPAA